MKTISLIIIILLSSPIFAQNPFLTLKFDKVVMYEFDGGKGGDLSVIDNSGKLAKTISKEITLDSNTIAEINKKLGRNESYGGGQAACYEPRLGLVYYLKNKVVAKIDICLDCNRLVSSLKINAQHQGKSISDDGEIFFLGEGMSKKFKQYFNQLIKKNGFNFFIKQ